MDGGAWRTTVCGLHRVGHDSTSNTDTGSLCFEEYKDALGKSLFPLLLILNVFSSKESLGPCGLFWAPFTPEGVPVFVLLPNPSLSPSCFLSPDIQHLAGQQEGLCSVSSAFLEALKSSSIPRGLTFPVPSGSAACQEPLVWLPL